MLRNLLKRNKEQKGFTIIEVLIVLAIAGLILVVVLVAIPQLQRNQRNEDRRAKVARIATEITSYAGNNNGEIPQDVNDLNDVAERYLGCTLVPADVPTDCTVNIDDPSSGEPSPVLIGNFATDGSVPSINDDATKADDPINGQLDIIYYQTNAVCEGESLRSGSARNFVLFTVLEGGAISCVDTQ
jgi:prepilin-type N-terminal cleavage/methylation domain-containing protein